MEKGQFLEYVTQQMIFREYEQGDLFSNSSKAREKNGVQSAVLTDDGSVTFFSEDFKEHYHASIGARTEAEEKFLGPSNLAEKLKVGEDRLLDVCFGLGYNSLCAMNLATKLRGNLTIDALEIDRRVVRNASKNVPVSEEDSFDWSSALTDLYETAIWRNEQCSVKMHWGDARWRLQQLPDETFDLVYLDAFSTQKCSELWSVEFFIELFRVMKKDAALFTYCAALPVRSGLFKAGFFVGETEPVGRARGGTIASKNATDILLKISDEELDAIENSTRGLPYHDPNLCWTNSGFAPRQIKLW